MKSSGIGGQAVIEGVMMKNNDVYSVAIRKPNKEIEVVEHEFVSTTKKNRLLALPFIRGVVNFIDSMRIGISTLTYSSSFYEEEDDEEQPSKFDEATRKLFKDKQEAVINGITIAISFVIAILVFMVLPYVISRLLDKYIASQFVLNTIEGVIKMIIFLLYVILISRLEDIKRVFMYHGAEHKSINCIENGLPLTVANVRKSSRFHKRCGTSFLLFVMIISIIMFIFIRFENRWLQLLARLLLIPVIAGISYEVLKLAGNSNNFLVNVISKPGLWLQRLTTKEPDDDMIEVAIAAVEKVFDWKAYLEDNAEEINREAEEAFEFIDMDQIDSINSLDDIEELFEKDIDEIDQTDTENQVSYETEDLNESLSAPKVNETESETNSEIEAEKEKEAEIVSEAEADIESVSVVEDSAELEVQAEDESDKKNESAVDMEAKSVTFYTDVDLVDEEHTDTEQELEINEYIQLEEVKPEKEKKKSYNKIFRRGKR